MRSNIQAKNIPKLRFPEFNNNWAEKNLKDIYKFMRNNSLSRAALGYSGDIKNIHYGDIHTKLPAQLNLSSYTLPSINNISITFNAEDFCKEGDLVIADTSEDYADIGKCIEIKNTNNIKAVAGLHTFLLRPIYDTATGFSGYMMRSRFVRKQIIKIATGVSVLGISKSNLTKVKLLIPSTREQQKIASFLTYVDEKISLLQKKTELLNKYKKGMMQKIFSRKIRFTDKSRRTYSNWENIQLKEVFVESRILGSKGNIAKKLTVKLWGKGVQEKNDQGGSLGTQYYKRKAGQFIYSKLDFLNCAFGIIPKELDGYESTIDLPAFDIGKGYDIRFLLERIKQKDFYKKNGETADGSRKARRIHADTFLSFKLSIPVFEEQQKIANFLSTIDERIHLEERKLEQAKRFKKSLLQQMFV